MLARKVREKMKYCIRCTLYVSQSKRRYVKVELSADDVEEAFSKFMSYLRKECKPFNHIMDLFIEEM